MYILMLLFSKLDSSILGMSLLTERSIYYLSCTAIVSLFLTGCSVLSPTPNLNSDSRFPSYGVKTVQPVEVNKTIPNPFINEIVKKSELEIKINGKTLSEPEVAEARKMLNAQVDEYFYNLRLDWFKSVVTTIDSSGLFREFSSVPSEGLLLDFELRFDKSTEFGQSDSRCYLEIPILTLGIIPAVCNRKYVIGYSVIDKQTGELFNFEYRYRSKEVLGWITYLLELFPGWDDTFEHKNLHLGFGVEVKKRLAEIRSIEKLGISPSL